MNAKATDISHLLQLLLDECRRTCAATEEIFAMIKAAAPCRQEGMLRFIHEVQRFGTRWACDRYSLVWK